MYRCSSCKNDYARDLGARKSNSKWYPDKICKLAAEQREREQGNKQAECISTELYFRVLRKTTIAYIFPKTDRDCVYFLHFDHAKIVLINIRVSHDTVFIFKLRVLSRGANWFVRYPGPICSEWSPCSVLTIVHVVVKEEGFLFRSVFVRKTRGESALRGFCVIGIEFLEVWIELELETDSLEDDMSNTETPKDAQQIGCVELLNAMVGKGLSEKMSKIRFRANVIKPTGNEQQ